MRGASAFSDVVKGYLLDLSQLPEGASKLLEGTAAERAAIFTGLGHAPTHTALDAHLLAALDMDTVNATVEAISGQVRHTLVFTDNSLTSRDRATAKPLLGRSTDLLRSIKTYTYD
jgi:hypothetical protein